MGAVFDSYKFGQKNNWRRRSWNEIARRVKNKRDAVVLYLPASEDLDRPVAVGKGFHPSNLIAVDTDIKVVDHLRKQGKLAIHDKLENVVAAWPEAPSIGVVFADFKCGFSQPVIDLVGHIWKCRGANPKTVVATNMLRGRDPVHFEWFTGIRKTYGLLALPEKHRGGLVYSALLHEMVEITAPGILGLSPGELIPEKFIQDCVNVALSHYQPWFSSYRSTAGTQRFDSIVYTNGFCCPESTRKVYTRGVLEENPELVKTVRQIAAALAIRTRRMRGDLPHCPAA